MSGGHFDYKQYSMREIADQIEGAIYKRNKKQEDYYLFSDKTVQESQTAIRKLHEAEVYAQRIDWLLSGDDGEDTFHERLKADLKELEKK